MTGPESRLSRISTLWSVVFAAHECSDEARQARAKLLERYRGAVGRYLRGVVRDSDVADDLGQEFAVRFLRGDFRHADPQRGRFRNLVKTALLNLVSDHFRRQKARPQLLPPDSPEPAAAQSTADPDRHFLDSWRAELLARAWEELAKHQTTSKQPFHTALRLRADQPELRACHLADRLSQQLGRPVTENWVRQVLHRARKLFADFLIDDVMQSLIDPTLEQVEEELCELGLSAYCRQAMQQRGRQASGLPAELATKKDSQPDAASP